MRYIVVLGSPSGHCCFDAAVQDTQHERYIEGKPSISASVCECFGVEDARRIADALNKAQG